MNREEAIRDLQKRYRQISQSLSEPQRRHWAAREATQLGRGGIGIVSKAIHISPNTIRKGMQEIESGEADRYSHENSRVRKPGGGRKPRTLDTAE